MWDAVLLVVSLALSAASGATLFFAPLVRTSRLIDILFIVSTSIAVIAAVRILARLATAWANRVAQKIEEGAATGGPIDEKSARSDDRAL